MTTTVFNGGNHLPINGPTNVAGSSANTSTGNNHQSGKPRQRARNLNVLRRQGRNEQNNSSINDSSSATQSTDELGSNRQRANKLSPFDLQPGSFPPLPGVPLAEEVTASSVVPAPPQSPTSPDVPANGLTTATGCLADVVKGKMPRKDQPRVSDNCSTSLRSSSVNEAGHHSASSSNCNQTNVNVNTINSSNNNNSNSNNSNSSNNSSSSNKITTDTDCANYVAAAATATNNTGTCDAICEPASHGEQESVAAGKGKPASEPLPSVEKAPEEVVTGQKSEGASEEDRSLKQIEVDTSKLNIKCNGTHLSVNCKNNNLNSSQQCSAEICPSVMWRAKHVKKWLNAQVAPTVMVVVTMIVRQCLLASQYSNYFIYNVSEKCFFAEASGYE